MDGIADRIGQLIKTSGLRSSSFAKEIGVSPSILSHILHGRNKPSLELILKIHSAMPDVDIEWLLTGSTESSSTSEDLVKKEVSVSSLQASSSSDRIIILRSSGTYEEFVAK